MHAPFLALSRLTLFVVLLFQACTVEAPSDSRGSVDMAAKPAITSVSPERVVAGDTLKVTGIGFGDAQDASVVMLGTSTVAAGSWADGAVTVNVPDNIGAGTYEIVLTIKGVDTNAVSVQLLPSVSAITPSEWVEGLNVAIDGANFGSEAGSVLVGGVEVPVVKWAQNRIDLEVTADVPAGSQSVIVESGGEASAAIAVTVKPSLSSISVESAVEGATVTLIGANLGASQGLSKLLVGTVEISPLQWSNQSVSFLVPAFIEPGSRDLSVFVGGQPSNSIRLTVVPTLRALGTTAGPETTFVTLEGSNLGASQGTSTLLFGGVTVTPLSWSYGLLTFNVPTGLTVGEKAVYVVTGGQVTNSLAFLVTESGHPFLSSASPAEVEAGETLTLTGGNFGATPVGVSEVRIDGIAIAHASWSDSQIQLVVQGGLPPGSHTVSMTANSLVSNEVSFSVVVPGAPVISSVTPNSGTGGSAVTLAGANFGNTQDASTLSVGGITVSPTSWSATGVSFAIPAALAAGTHAVVVTVDAQPSNSVNLAVTPTITSVTPSTAIVAGATVTLTGTNFGASAAGAVLTVGGDAVAPASWGASSVTFTLPASTNPGARPVVITVGGQASNTVGITVQPDVTALSDNSGSGGDSLTLTGTNLGSATGVVTIGGTQAVVLSWSRTSVVVTVPESVAPGGTTVQLMAGTQSAAGDAFTIVPRIDGLSPIGGVAETSVTLTGVNLGTTGTLTFGGAAITPISWAATRIVFSIPVGATAGDTSVVVTAGGQSSNSVTFAVTASGQPTITGLSASLGSGGDPLIISGSNFTATEDTVTMGGASVTVSSWADTSITVVVPTSLAPGTHQVVISVGGVNSNAVNFAVRPRVSTVSPSFAAAGTTITLTGLHFGTSGTLTVGGNVVSTASWSDSGLSFVVPAEIAAGSRPIVVTSGGWSSPSAAFTVGTYITTLSPQPASAGTTVTLTGANFGSGQETSTITVGGVGITPATWSHTAITFSVPATLQGGVHSVALTVNSQSASANLRVQPALNDFTLTTGSGGTNVTASGSGFGLTRGGSRVSVGGFTATVAGWNADAVIFSIPDGVTAGTRAVTITVGGETSNSRSLTVTPLISSLSPVTAAAGATVTISGKNFGIDGGSLSVGGLAVTASMWSAGSIQFVVPASLAAGTHDLLVTVNGVVSNASSLNVTPSIGSVGPASGSSGDAITISGTNFGTSGTLLLGSTAIATSSWSTAEVVFQVPASIAGGVYTLTVQTGGQSAQSSFRVAPVLTARTPVYATAGSTVTLTGKNFGTAQDTSLIRLGAEAQPATAWSATSVSFALPAAVGAGAHDLTLVVGGETTNALSITVLPRVDSVSPASGPVESLVSIAGSNFGASTGAVTIGGVAAAVSAWDQSAIDFTVPTGLSLGSTPVVVTAAGLNSNTATFNVSTGPAPAISSVSPASGSGGTLVVVSGSDFASAGTATVGGTVVTTSSWTSTTVQFTLPDTITAGSRSIVIQSGTDGQSSSPAAFAVVPAIGSLSSSEGSAGLSVAVSGTNFGTNAADGALSLGGTTLTPTSWTNTQINFTVPASLSAGTHALALTVNGQAASPVNFLVRPRIDGVSPGTGLAGSAVTLSGVHFGDVQGSVTVGGQSATVTAWSSTAIEITVPIGLADGTHDVIAVVNAVQSNVTGFTVGSIPIPVITSVSPSEATAGTIITISGSAFGNETTGSTVSIGGYDATILSWSDTSITVQAAPWADAGVNDVSVWAAGEQSNVATVILLPHILDLRDSYWIAAADVLVSGWDELEIYGSNLNGANFVLEIDSGNGWYDPFGGEYYPYGTDIFASLPNSVTAGSHSVRVTAGGYSSNAYPFAVWAGIDNLSQTEGPVGTRVAIGGAGFGNSQGSSTVQIGGSLATIESWSATEIVFFVPALSTDMYHEVIVTINGIQAVAPNLWGPLEFLVTSWGIQSVSPESVYGGDEITIAGTGFTSTQGSVSIGYEPAEIISWSDTQIVAVVSTTSSPGQTAVQVTDSGGMNSSNTYDIFIVRRITALSASTGTGGDELTITGTNLGDWEQRVSIGGYPAAVSTWTATAVTAYVPADVPAGLHDVVLGYEWDLPTNALPFTVYPTLTSLSPISGPYGTTVGINGTNFGVPATANAITVGGVSATISSIRAQSARFTIPNGAPTGLQNVLLTASGETSNPLTINVLSWGIVSVTPGTATGGATVTVAGTGFGTQAVGDAVYLGATQVSVTQWTDTQITFVVPATLAGGTTTISVFNGGSLSNVLPFIIVPNLSSLTPESGGVGTSVTLSGTNFGNSETGNRVMFGGVPATVSGWTNTSITVTVPEAAVPGLIEAKVIVGGAGSQTRSFTHTRPWIDARYPAMGTVGTSLSLIGRYFGNSQGTAAIGGTAGLVEGWTDTAVQVQVQPGTPKGRQLLWLEMPSGVSTNVVSYTQRGSDVWIPFEPLGEGRSFNATVWTGVEMIVWGGGIGDIFRGSNSGARYNPATDSWLPVSQTGAPSARTMMTSAWSGSELIVWSGASEIFNNALSDGGRYNPLTDSWRSLQTAGAPSGRILAGSAWLDGRLFIWGGAGQQGLLADGAIYDPLTDSWEPVQEIGFVPPPRYDFSTIWTGAEVIVWGGSNGIGGYFADGGRYNPVTGEWRLMAMDDAPSARASHSTVWTGSEMIVWGGGPIDIFGSGGFSEPVSTGGRYDPALDRWRPTAIDGNTPQPAIYHAGQWAGSQMLVWGGFFGDGGGRYDPLTDSWLPMNAVGGPDVGLLPSSVWTGEAFIVWGGVFGGSAGGKYDPIADTWTLMEGSYMPMAGNSRSVWSGSEMLVFGSGWARYNPATDSWLPILPPADTLEPEAAVWGGTMALVWGEYSYCDEYGCWWEMAGRRYNPQDGSWSAMSMTGAPLGRYGAIAAWTGSDVIVWGGADDVGNLLNDGALYNPAGDAWRPVAVDAYTPPGRRDASVVWAGDQLIVWGGTDVDTWVDVNEGARYRPLLDAWAPVATTDAPVARSGHAAVWAGGRMLIYGGTDIGNAALYDPAGDFWTAVTSTNEPEARSNLFAGAMGDKVLIAGGDSWSTYDPLSDGAVYDVINDTWSPVTQTRSPADWSRTPAAHWTGEQLLLWGGSSVSPIMTRYLP